MSVSTIQRCFARGALWSDTVCKFVSTRARVPPAWDSRATQACRLGPKPLPSARGNCHQESTAARLSTSQAASAPRHPAHKSSSDPRTVNQIRRVVNAADSTRIAIASSSRHKLCQRPIFASSPARGIARPLAVDASPIDIGDTNRQLNGSVTPPPLPLRAYTQLSSPLVWLEYSHRRQIKGGYRARSRFKLKTLCLTQNRVSSPVR
jgi:hypothetical protein